MGTLGSDHCRTAFPGASASMANELEWRRRWKPDLKSSAWQLLEIDDDTFMIKLKFTETSYEVLITDFTTYWFESLDEKAVRRRIQKLNPNIEAPLTRILDQVKNSVVKPSKGTTLSAAFKNEGEKLMVTVNSQLAGMPFTWHFLGAMADNSMICAHMTLPLLAMVSEMTHRQKELVKILKSKDKEIEDYKAQGVSTSRKHIETVTFDETAFRDNMVTSKGFEDRVRQLKRTAFEASGQELYRQIMIKNAYLTSSPVKADSSSPSLSSDESLAAAPQGTNVPSWAARFPPSLGQSKPSSPYKSPNKSPNKSVQSSRSTTPDSSPTKDTELMRRQALERRLEEEESKKQEKTKKKKKIAF